MIFLHRHMDLSPGQSDMLFRDKTLTDTLSRQWGGCGVSEIFFDEEECGRISGGTRVLELRAENREVALWHGARY
jgi:hypothetical protein